MNTLFTDWFIFNIEPHITTQTLYNLKLTNKYYNNQITYKYIYSTINKKIKDNKADAIGFVVQADPHISKKIIPNGPIPLIIPNNTEWKFTMDITPIGYPMVMQISGTVRDVLGHIDKFDVNYGFHRNWLKLSIVNNTLVLELMEGAFDLMHVGTIIIKATKF